MLKKIKVASDYVKELLEENKPQRPTSDDNSEFIDFHKSIETMMTSGHFEKNEVSEPNIFQRSTAKQF